MTGAEKAGIILEGLALLREKQPELLASILANDPFAAIATRAWLANTMGEHRPADKAAPLPTRWNPPVVAPGQLPTWPDKARAIPNVFLRSALFGAIRRGQRRTLDREPLAALGQTNIIYTGPRLDQGDLDAWQAILHAFRGQDTGREGNFTTYRILKNIGLKASGKNLEVLKNRIERLSAGTIEINGENIGGIIGKVDRVEKKWAITLNPRLNMLFAPAQYTRLQWEVRRALATKPLAQWLHGYYSSHAKPYPVRIETLKQLCGSEAGERKSFTQNLKKALEEVEQASAEAGSAFKWRIENKLVYVTRTPTAAQHRHLEKRQ